MANVYLKDVASFGYKAAVSAAATIGINIEGKSGGRVAVRAFGFTCGSVATSLAFMQTLGRTTVNGAVASGLTTVTLTSATIGGGATVSPAAVAAADLVAIKQDGNKWLFTQVKSVASTIVEFYDALTAAVADGSEVYGFGVFTDAGHAVYSMSANGQTTKDLHGGGIFYGTARGDPMVIYQLALASSTVQSFDYATIDYINK